MTKARQFLVIDWAESTHYCFVTKIEQCGVVPNGLLTFLGSLYEEVAKTTSGPLVYRFKRQTNRKKEEKKHCP